MRILYFCADLGGRPAYFVKEQVEALLVLNPSIKVEWCLCGHTGILGGWRKLQALKRTIRAFHPDIIHAHNGMYGLIANLQGRIPVVTTYHGSDVHRNIFSRMLSGISTRLSAYNIFVGEALRQMVRTNNKNATVIPCGVDLDIFYLLNQKAARKATHMVAGKKYVLFTSHFTNKVKDPELAFRVMEKFPDAELIELKDQSRVQVNMLLNAVDALLMTSKREGSPQIIKEAIAAGTPIVTVNVGDVKHMLANVENAAISISRNAKELAVLLQDALAQSHSKRGGEIIQQLGMDNTNVAQRILQVYKQVRNQK